MELRQVGFQIPGRTAGESSIVTLTGLDEEIPGAVFVDTPGEQILMVDGQAELGLAAGQAAEDAGIPVDVMSAAEVAEISARAHAGGIHSVNLVGVDDVIDLAGFFDTLKRLAGKVKSTIFPPGTRVEAEVAPGITVDVLDPEQRQAMMDRLGPLARSTEVRVVRPADQPRQAGIIGQFMAAPLPVKAAVGAAALFLLRKMF